MRGMIIGLGLIAAAPAAAADYVVIALHADVAAPADTAWAKVGSYCDIAKWAKMPCTLVSGSGGVGSVRRLLGGIIEEPMIGATAHSYTYGQSIGMNKDIDYHATLAIEPTGPRTSRIDYTLMYDPARIAPEKRAGMADQMRKTFGPIVQNIKLMAEAK